MMLDIAKPFIEVQKAEIGDENYARFSIAPLEPGFGHTLGNALRRVLLSSITGAAITKVKIEGVFHEFSTIAGVREDVTEIVLNIKGIRLRSHTDLNRKVRVNLVRQGKGPVLARHMDLPSSVELVNPDHYICELDGNDNRIEMEFTIEKGKGYQPAEMGEIVNIGEIPVDAIFTPISKVNYLVESTRVGQATNHDRLIIEIFTDGAITPYEALRHAAKVLVKYNEFVADFNGPDPVEDEDIHPIPLIGDTAIPASIMERSVDQLELSTRTHNSLRRADITTIGQILQMDEKQLKAVRNLGEKSLDEIRDKVREVCEKVGFNPGGKWGKAATSPTTAADESE